MFILSAQIEERFGDLPSLFVNGPQYQGSRSVIPNNHISIVLIITILAAFLIPHHGGMLNYYQEQFMFSIISQRERLAVLFLFPVIL